MTIFILELSRVAVGQQSSDIALPASVQNVTCVCAANVTRSSLPVATANCKLLVAAASALAAGWLVTSVW